MVLAFSPQQTRELFEIAQAFESPWIMSAEVQFPTETEEEETPRQEQSPKEKPSEKTAPPAQTTASARAVKFNDECCPDDRNLFKWYKHAAAAQREANARAQQDAAHKQEDLDKKPPAKDFVEKKTKSAGPPSPLEQRYQRYQQAVRARREAEAKAARAQAAPVDMSPLEEWIQQAARIQQEQQAKAKREADSKAKAKEARVHVNPAFPNAPKVIEQHLPIHMHKETPEFAKMSLDMSGFEPDDIAIDINDFVVSIQGKRTNKLGDTFMINRHLRLDKNTAMVDEVTASLDDGILELTVPKKGAVKPRRKVPIVATGSFTESETSVSSRGELVDSMDEVMLPSTDQEEIEEDPIVVETVDEDEMAVEETEDGEPAIVDHSIAANKSLLQEENWEEVLKD